MKNLLLVIIITILVSSSAFGQGEYLKDNTNGIAIGFNYGISDFVHTYTSQIALSMDKTLDLGLEFGAASTESRYYSSHRNTSSLFGVYTNLHLPTPKNSTAQMSLTLALTNADNVSAFLISPNFYINARTETWTVKFFFSPGYFNIMDVPNEENMFISYGFSPYVKWSKHTTFILNFSGTNYDTQNTFSFGLGFLFGFGEPSKKIDVDDSKDKKKKKKRGSYYGR